MGGLMKRGEQNQPGKKNVKSAKKVSMGRGKPVRGKAQKQAAIASRKDALESIEENTDLH
jgi:hypothetical protein